MDKYVLLEIFLLATVIALGIIAVPTASALTWPGQNFTWSNAFYYGFNESSGTLCKEELRGMNITVNGNINRTTGIHSNAITCNGDNSAIYGIPDIAAARNYSLSFWFRPNCTGTMPQTVAGVGKTGVAYPLELILQNTSCGMDVFVESGSTDYKTNGTALKNQWNHVMFTCSGDTGNTHTRVYLNSHLMYKDDTNVCITPATLRSMACNRNNGLQDYYGGLDEFTYWNRTLSLGEMLQLYNNGTGFFKDSDTGGATTSCTYGGTGSWLIQASDNCNITTNVTLQTKYSNITINGTGTTTFFANITNVSYMFINGISSASQGIVRLIGSMIFK